MKIFLTIAAILAWVFGLALLLVPGKFYSPVGITFSPLLATVAQAHGATLFGLGVINWFARKADRQGLVAVLAGNLCVQILSLIIVIVTMRLGAGTNAMPGAVIHIVLGSMFAYFLFSTLKNNSVKS